MLIVIATQIKQENRCDKRSIEQQRNDDAAGVNTEEECHK